MEKYWEPGRYINIYNTRMDRHKRDLLFRQLKKSDPLVYDVRIEKNSVEIAYFFQINNITKSIMGKNFFTSSINYIQNAKSFSYAIYLIGEERYWEAHEVLENYWRNSNGLEKTTYQYIILLCAAEVHKQRGHDSVARGIIIRSGKIKTLDTIRNIDISGIKREKSYNPDIELRILIPDFQIKK
ncbi:DUF309 domain-containing protein [Ferroplasma sp.]|uniref:DUF309 domain-containing protein n=1 Tax=Ferroplasma sp. TaxID=2591003 RepID=UPI00307F3A66